MGEDIHMASNHENMFILTSNPVKADKSYI